MTEQPQTPTDPVEFAQAIGRDPEPEAAPAYVVRIGEQPVTQTWMVTGVRCRNGEEQYEAGPEAVPDGTQAYLSLPDDCVEDERDPGDIWLADPVIKRLSGEPLPPPRHTPLRVWQERPGEISWRCSCGLFMRRQRLEPVGPTDLVCTDNLEHEPEVVVERYQADLAADIRTRIAAAMTVTGADVLRYIVDGTWTAPRQAEQRECHWCQHYHLCTQSETAPWWECHTCGQGGRCLG